MVSYCTTKWFEPLWFFVFRRWIDSKDQCQLISLTWLPALHSPMLKMLPFWWMTVFFWNLWIRWYFKLNYCCEIEKTINIPWQIALSLRIMTMFIKKRKKCIWMRGKPLLLRMHQIQFGSDNETKPCKTSDRSIYKVLANILLNNSRFASIFFYQIEP